MQERRNSIAITLDLRLSSTNPSILLEVVSIGSGYFFPQTDEKPLLETLII